VNGEAARGRQSENGGDRREEFREAGLEIAEHVHAGSSATRAKRDRLTSLSSGWLHRRRPATRNVCRPVPTPTLTRNIARNTLAAVATDEDMKAELERLRAENAALKSRKAAAVSLKVSEKGAVSVYGLGRFPVTLYKEQWTKLLDMADEIKAFIAANDSKLKAKE
jgi:hypothetical protein